MIQHQMPDVCDQWKKYYFIIMNVINCKSHILPIYVCDQREEDYFIIMNVINCKSHANDARIVIK